MRVSKSVRGARNAGGGSLTRHGSRHIRCSARPNSAAALPAARHNRRSASARRVASNASDDEQERRQHEGARRSWRRSARRSPEARTVFQEHPHVGIADAVGARQGPAQRDARAGDISRAQWLRPTRRSATPAAFRRVKKSRSSPPPSANAGSNQGFASVSSGGARRSAIARALQHRDRAARMADVRQPVERARPRLRLLVECEEDRALQRHRRRSSPARAAARPASGGSATRRRRASRRNASSDRRAQRATSALRTAAMPRSATTSERSGQR